MFTDRRWALIFVLIVFSMGCASDPNVKDFETSSDPLSITEPYQVTRQCFSGVYSDYDEWRKTSLARGIPSGGFSWRFPKPEYTKYKQGLSCYFFEYKVDGLSIEGFLIRPRATGNQRLPVVISNRGGNAGFGRNNTSGFFKTNFALASKGFVVLGSQYRGGRPKGQQDPIYGKDEFGGKDVRDILALIDIIDVLPFADPGRIGMLGWSRGGFMSFIAASKTDRISALAVGGSPSDLLAELEIRPQMENVYRARIPNYDDNKIDALRERSPLFLVEKIAPNIPVLILHGQLDKAVSLSNATNLAARLKELGRRSRLVVYEADDHGIWKNRLNVQEEINDWFKTKLIGSN